MDMLGVNELIRLKYSVTEIASTVELEEKKEVPHAVDVRFSSFHCIAEH